MVTVEAFHCVQLMIVSYTFYTIFHFPEYVFLRPALSNKVYIPEKDKIFHMRDRPEYHYGLNQAAFNGKIKLIK